MTDKRCCKCGATDIIRRYDDGTGPSTFYERGKACAALCREGKEHLDYTCRGCGYKWVEPCESEAPPTSEDEGEKWGKVLWDALRDAGIIGVWPSTEQSERSVISVAALRFRDKCVGPRKELEEAAKEVEAWWHGPRGIEREDWTLFDRLRAALSALPDQGEPPEDPGHDAIRGDPARVDEHGMVETGMEEKPSVSDEDLGCFVLTLFKDHLSPIAVRSFTKSSHINIGATIRAKLGA